MAGMQQGGREPVLASLPQQVGLNGRFLDAVFAEWTPGLLLGRWDNQAGAVHPNRPAVQEMLHFASEGLNQLLRTVPCEADHVDDDIRLQFRDMLAEHALQFSFTAIHLDQLDLNFSRAVVRNSRPVFVFGARYTLARLSNDTNGPFSPPVDNANPGADWGPAASDVRHRGMGMVMATLPKGFSVTAIGTASSAPPYTITTGIDNNHDTIVNDRPAGVARNSARGSGQFDVLARVGWTLGFGKPPEAQNPLPNMRRLRSDAERDPLGASGSVGQQPKRYRIQFYVQAYNLLNRVNRIGYRGVMGTPLFGQATASMPPRRLEVGTRFDF